MKIIQTSTKLLHLGNKEGISTEEFKEFIDGSFGQGFGIDALMKICKTIDISLMNGQTLYPRVFHNQLI